MKKPPATAAFSLVELTIAIGIAALCLVGVFALVPVGALTNRNATCQTAAINLIAAVVADMRATPKTSPTSVQFCIPFATSGSSTLYFDGAGQCSTDLAGSTNPCGGSWSAALNIRYQLNITWGSSTAVPSVPYANVKVSWPAAATLANANGSVETFAAFARN
jgi:hypothetical protein